MTTPAHIIETAKARFAEINAAVMREAIGAISPADLRKIEADCGYRHGWFLIDGHSVGAHEYAEGGVQPIMD